MIEKLRNKKHQLSTKRNYHTIWKLFNKFIISLDFIPKSWEEKLSLYCGYLVDIKKVQSSTLRSYVSAIKQTLIIDGYRWDPEEFILSTFTKSCKMENDRVKTRLPIKKGLLELILYDLEITFNEQNYLEKAYKAIFIICYYGMMRIGEVVNGEHVIKVSQVHMDTIHNQKMLIVLYTSKTHGKGDRPQYIKINAMINNGEKPTNFCPIRLTQDYIRIRNNKINPTPEQNFFLFSDGSTINPCHVRSVLRQSLENLQLKSKLYDTHSFRIGRATDLRRMGKHVEDIKQWGRWKSNTVYKYLRD